MHKASATSSRSAKSEKSAALLKGVTERGIGTPEAYFQVVITHHGKTFKTERFPYRSSRSKSLTDDTRDMALAKANKLAAREKTLTVFKGVYERGIDTDLPYFQVRVRRKGQDSIVERFPYVPDAKKGNRPGMSREVAKAAAIAAASKEKSEFHFYAKPTSQVANEQTLRDWITAWKSEACDHLDPVSGKAITNMPHRKTGVENGKQVMRFIAMADAYAQKHKEPNLMDKRVVELTRRPPAFSSVRV